MQRAGQQQKQEAGLESPQEILVISGQRKEPRHEQGGHGEPEALRRLPGQAPGHQQECPVDREIGDELDEAVPLPAVGGDEPCRPQEGQGRPVFAMGARKTIPAQFIVQRPAHQAKALGRPLVGVGLVGAKEMNQTQLGTQGEEDDPEPEQQTGTKPWTAVVLHEGKRSEFQPSVRMAALGARGGVGVGLLGVELVAPDAVEGNLAALGIVDRPVPAVVIDPEAAEPAQHQQAVEDDIEGEIRRRDHAGSSHEAAPEPRGNKNAPTWRTAR